MLTFRKIEDTHGPEVVEPSDPFEEDLNFLAETLVKLQKERQEEQLRIIESTNHLIPARADANEGERAHLHEPTPDPEEALESTVTIPESTQSSLPVSSLSESL